MHADCVFSIIMAVVCRPGDWTLFFRGLLARRWINIPDSTGDEPATMELDRPEQEEPEYDQFESEDQPLSEEERAQYSREEEEYDTFVNRLTPCYNCKGTNPRVLMINMVGVFKQTLFS